MDRILSTYSYGICLFSMEVLQDFLKKEKIRSKKLLHKFQKDKKLYLAMQKEGIWFPISKINSGQHLIKLEGYDNTFNDEWEQKFEIEGFNLKIEGGLWISDIGSFYTFNEGEFCGEAISFKTGDGDIQYSDFKYDACAGKSFQIVPGEQFVYDKNNRVMDVRMVDTESYVSWKDGYYKFRQTTLEEIMETLSVWYGLNVFYVNESAKQVEFTGKVRRYEDARMLLDKFEQTGDVVFDIKGNNVFITIKQKKPFAREWNSFLVKARGMVWQS